MTTVLVRHKVGDYAKWEAVFKGADGLHSGAGVRHAQVFRSAEDPNEVVVLTEFENLEKARQFAQHEGLHQAMKDGGVVGQPQVLFIEKSLSRSWS